MILGWVLYGFLFGIVVACAVISVRKKKITVMSIPRLALTDSECAQVRQEFKKRNRELIVVVTRNEMAPNFETLD